MYSFNPNLDDKDKDIVRIASEIPGIRLSEMAQKIGLTNLTVRLRLYDLERIGAIEIRRERNRFMIFPHGGVNYD